MIGVHCGAPQGSVIGPWPYFIYNDLLKLTDRNAIRQLYAIQVPPSFITYSLRQSVSELLTGYVCNVWQDSEVRCKVETCEY